MALLDKETRPVQVGRQWIAAACLLTLFIFAGATLIALLSSPLHYRSRPMDAPAWAIHTWIVIHVLAWVWFFDVFLLLNVGLQQREVPEQMRRTGRRRRAGALVLTGASTLALVALLVVAIDNVQRGGRELIDTVGALLAINGVALACQWFSLPFFRQRRPSPLAQPKLPADDGPPTEF